MLYDHARMRIGDTERNQVSEALGKHFADGRLDEQEFHERIEKAMAAKTEGELAGLLIDLPRLGDQQSPVIQTPVGAPRVREASRLVVVALVMLVVLRSLSWWLWHAAYVFVWPVALVLGLALLRGRGGFRRSL